jgi:hypothetical protein
MNTVPGSQSQSAAGSEFMDTSGTPLGISDTFLAIFSEVSE